MTARSLHRSAVEHLTTFVPDPHDPGADAVRHTMLAFLAAAPDGCLRACAPGHVTASTVVLDPDGRVLLTLHPRVGRWIQLGGHCEPEDDTVEEAALREAVEESGIGGLTLDPRLLSVHTHPITCSLGVPTRHLDLRFAAYAPRGAEPVRSDESTDLRWFAVDDLPPDAEHETITSLADWAARRGAPAPTV